MRRSVARVAYLAVMLTALLGNPAVAETYVWINGHCVCGDKGIPNVTVRVDRKVGEQWQTYSGSSTTKDRGIWGVGVLVEGVSWLRFRPIAPPGYTLYGARYPGGYHARYIPGVGIELQAPSANAGHFDFLFRCQQEPTPTATVTTTPTATAIPTTGALPTQTPFPGVEEWVDPPQSLENVVTQDALDLVAGWLASRGPLYQYAWDHGLGPFPIYGPVRVTFADFSGDVWEIEYILYPCGHLVWHDVSEPRRVRITQVDRYSW